MHELHLGHKEEELEVLIHNQDYNLIYVTQSEVLILKDEVWQEYQCKRA